MLQRIYDGVMEKAAHRHAIWWLAAVSFIESSIFPIPPDVMLIPMVLAAPTRWFRIAFVCTAASVAGGFLGYLIGFAMFETVGQPVLAMYHLAGKFQTFQDNFNEYGAAIVAIAGFTPFPYKVITIASGVTHMDLTTFSAASVVSRGARFFLISALLWRFGPSMRLFVEKNFKLVSTAFVVLLIGGFAVLKLL